MPDISEKDFEATIECALLAGGPDACPGDGAVVRKPTPAYSTLIPGGHLRRTAKTWVTARPFGFRKTQRVWIVTCRRDEKRESPFTKRKSRRRRR